MSMISEQVKELKWYASYQDCEKVKKMMYQAADIIESLSAKLQAANTERTKKYYNGEKSEYDIERILNCLDEIWTFGEEPTDDEREAVRDAIDIIQNMERSAEDSKTERLTERTNDGILVKEDYGEGVLKTLYQCYGAEPMPHYANCDDRYCAMEKLVQHEDLEEQREMKGGWIPCSERLPEESLDSVIGWDECRKRCCFVQYLGGRWIFGNDTVSVKITAWQPLPEEYHG